MLSSVIITLGSKDGSKFAVLYENLPAAGFSAGPSDLRRNVRENEP